VDSGVSEGSDISMFYDPMICKLVTHAPDRKASIDLMGEALDSYVIRGVQHNVAFCRALCNHKKFRAGDLSTDFIGDEYPDGFRAPDLSGDRQRQLISAALCMHATIERPSSGVVEMVCGVGSQGSQVLTTPRETVRCDFDRNTFTFVESNTTVDMSDVRWAGAHVPLFHAKTTESHEAHEAESAAHPVTFQYVQRLNQGLRLQDGGTTYDVAVLSPLEHELSAFMIPKEMLDMSKSLMSPMPGSLVSVSVEVGQSVEDGQELAVVEAMKMQNILRAEAKGVVKEVVASVGDNLQVDQLILEFE